MLNISFLKNKTQFLAVTAGSNRLCNWPLMQQNKDNNIFHLGVAKIKNFSWIVPPTLGGQSAYYVEFIASITAILDKSR